MLLSGLNNWVIMAFGYFLLLVYNRNGWKKFAIKRIVRIVPLYWLFTTIKIISLIFPTSYTIHAHRLEFMYILKSYLFIPALNEQNIFFPIYTVGWTLNFEMFFYFFFAIALLLKVKPGIFISIIFIPLVILSQYKTNSWGIFSFYCDPILLYFILGMAIASLAIRELILPKRVSYASFAICLLILLMPGQYFKMNSVAESLSVFFCSFFIIYACISIETLDRITVPSKLLLLGSASYSLYILHPLIVPFAPIFLNYMNFHVVPASVALGTSISILSGLLFYKYFEKPVSRYFARFADQKSTNNFYGVSPD